MVETRVVKTRRIGRLSRYLQSNSRISLPPTPRIKPKSTMSNALPISLAYGFTRGNWRSCLSCWPSFDRGARVLEVGVARSYFLLQVLHAGYRVDGVDASPHMLRKAETKLAGHKSSAGSPGRGSSRDP